MRSTRTALTTAVVLTAVLMPASLVQADVWGDALLGFEAFGYQFSGQRNLLGNGWDISMGQVYNGQEYDFGVAQLTLGSATSPVASSFQAGYTLRGIPRASFSWNTGGVALPYTFQINNGIQDFTTVNGTFLADVSTDINALGFYDTKVQISNRGSYTTDGFAGDNSGSLAYDVGPINITGNIYLDALAAITEPFFNAAGQENPFSKLSGRSAKEAQLKSTVADLQARAAAGEVLSDEDMATLVNSTLLSAIISGDQSRGDLFTSLVTPDSQDATASRSLRTTSLIPEPSSLLLLGVMTMLATGRPRRRRA